MVRHTHLSAIFVIIMLNVTHSQQIHHPLIYFEKRLGLSINWTSKHFPLIWLSCWSFFAFLSLSDFSTALLVLSFGQAFLLIYDCPTVRTKPPSLHFPYVYSRWSETICTFFGIASYFLSLSGVLENRRKSAKHSAEDTHTHIKSMASKKWKDSTIFRSFSGR